MKLLDTERDRLSSKQIEEAETVAIEKARILIAGSIKRGNEANASIITEILSSLEHGSYKRKDYQNLLLLRCHP